ncbi:MAG: type I-E CRISPR-associated endoribonuclease Cas2e [Myxococcota bacterium]
MSMTIVVTRNVPARFRGFLASCMLELTPGVYTAPRMNKAVRERIWRVLREWWEQDPGRSIVMTWADRSQRSGQSIRILGAPPIELVEVQGIFLSKKPVSPELTYEDLL